MNPMKIKELKEGWLIILATILQFLLGYPANILPMCSILFAPKEKAFNASGTEKAMIVGLLTVFMNIVSIFAGPLVKARNPRFVAVLATSSQVLGLVICAFSSSISQIMLGFGIFVGAGVGFALINNIIITKKNFPNSMGIAIGIALTFICLTGLVIPQIFQLLLEYFQGHGDPQNQWTILIYALLGCVGYLGALLMTSQSGDEEAAPVDIEADQEQSELKQMYKEFTVLLKDVDYLVTALANSCCFSIMVYSISLLGPIVSSRTLPHSSADFVTIFCAGNALSLLPMGLLGDSTILRNMIKYPKKSLYLACCVGLTFTFFLLSVSHSYTSLVLGTALLAIFTSGMFITTNLVYYDCFPTKFESAVGLSNLFRCFFALSINPLAGYFEGLEDCENMHCSLQFLTGTTFFLILLWIGVPLLFKWRRV